MKKNVRKTIILLVAILIISSVLNIYYETKKIQNAQRIEIPALVIVSDKPGVGIIPGTVFFGRMKPGDSGSTAVNINNTSGKELVAVISGQGRIKDFLIEKKEYLETGENKEVGLTVRIPQGTPSGEYKGSIVILTRIK
jgi:hypothetical protein